MVSIKKKQQVEEIKELISSSSNFAFFGFGNITHQNLEDLRKSVRKLSGKIKVVKNTLLQKAIARLTSENKSFDNVKKLSEELKDKTAILTLDTNYSPALKSILDFSKSNENISFKFGLLDGQLYPSEQLAKIAALPSKEELLSKIVYVIKYPSTKLHFILQSPISKLINVLKSEKISSNSKEVISND